MAFKTVKKHLIILTSNLAMSYHDKLTDRLFNSVYLTPSDSSMEEWKSDTPHIANSVVPINKVKI